MSLVLLLYVVLLAWEVDSLTCACNICTKGSFCVVDSVGSHCAAMAFPSSGGPIIQTRCFNSTESSAFCNISNSNVAIECCSSHYCNTQLRPPLPPVSSNTSPTATTIPVIKPTLIPGPTTEKPTTAQPPIKCHKYNSNKPPKDYPYCNTASGSCYRLQRLAPNGTVILEKQGCLNDCVNEKRNRVIKECCNTTLCNGDAPPPAQKPLPSIIQTNTPIFSTVTTAAASVSSSTRINSISSTSLSYTTTSSKAIIHNQTPTVTNNGEVITLIRDSEFESAFLILVPLCIVYLFVTILVVSLVVVICYKQRQIKRLETTVRVMKVTQKQPQSVSSYDGRTASTSSDGSTSV